MKVKGNTSTGIKVDESGVRINYNTGHFTVTSGVLNLVHPNPMSLMNTSDSIEINAVNNKCNIKLPFSGNKNTSGLKIVSSALSSGLSVDTTSGGGIIIDPENSGIKIKIKDGQPLRTTGDGLEVLVSEPLRIDTVTTTDTNTTTTY